MAKLNVLLATNSVAIDNLRKAPMKVINAADGGAVAILNQNAPAAYVVSPKMMAVLLDLAADQLAQQRAHERPSAPKKAKAVSLSDL